MAINLGTKVLASAMLGTTAIQRIYLGPIMVWQNEVVATISSNTAHVVLPGAYFSSTDWANPLVRKRLVVDGAIIWSYTQGVVALDLGSGRQGELHVEIKANSYVLGHAGARNSGAGGTAILVRQNQCWITNAGFLYGGGGGGGAGGAGGPGYYQTPYTYTEGPTYGRQSYAYTQNSWNGNAFYWGGYISGGNGFWYGDWYYYAVSVAETYTENRTTTTAYSVARQQTRYNTYYTSGGGGGTGGTGAGFNASVGQLQEGGFAGAGGGQNAGTGGPGGSGGGWGAAGGAGATGNSGNNGAGGGGAAGGAAGAYIVGYGNLNSFSNTGTLLGRQG